MRVFSIELPGTLVFDYPTLEAIQTFICDSMQSLAGENVTVSSASLATEVQDVEDTLSMLCTSFALKGPSGMTTSSGKKIDTISRVPFARWDLDTVSSEYRDTRPPTFGSFMQDIAAFDIACTGLGLGEAKLMDVQQRALIQLTLELKMSSMALNGTTPVGVFVGISNTDYGRLCSKFQANVTTYSATGGALNVASGRLSYTFDFRGPAMSIDTACSSSLVTTHLANMQRKFSRTTNIVAGVNILTTPETTMMFHKAGMLSADGRCKTLDASADGYVRGEFCGALCIESAEAAEATQSDNSLPVAVLGTAVNQDGRSSALTAPNGPAQQMVIRSALQHKSLDGGDVSLLQMHGTGTPLGDPIEVGALNAVLMDKRVDEHPLTLAAGKSGIGHTEPGAGAAGLIHSIEALINAASAAVVHLTSVNPHLHQIIGSKEKSKFNLPKISLGISHNVGDGDVVGGVSSFAFQGTNSHAILGCGSFSVYNKEDSSLSWQPQRCWVVPPVHPLLTSCLGFNAFDGTVKFQTSLTKALHAYLWDHQIQSKPLFPGAGYLEMGTALGQLMTDGGFASIVVEGASIPAPLVLPDSVTQFDEKVVEICVNALQSAHFSISSLSTRNGSTFSIEHFRASLGWLERSEGTSEQAISTPLCLCNEALRAQSTVPVPTSLLYAAMHSVGLQYMTKFQVLKTIRHQGSSSGEAFAQIGGQATSALNGMYTHPSALDGCLQLGATSLVSHASTDDQQTQVPAGIEAFVVYQQSKSAVLHAVAKTLHSSAQESVSQHGLYDPQGGCSSTVYNLLTKSMSSGASGVAASKAAMREKRSMTYFVQWNACLAESTISMPSDVSFKLELALESEVSSMGLALSIVRDVMNKGHMPLNLRTFGAHGALDYPTNQVNTSQGHLWGLLPTVAQECQNLVCGGIDAGVEDPSNALGGDPLIVDSLLMKSVDSDVQGEALRGGTLLVPTLLASRAHLKEAHSQLVPNPRGSFSSLTLQTIEPLSSTTMDMILQVHTVGLNFRDVLNILDMYPGDPGMPGGDCSGVVVDIRDSGSFCVGQAVFGLAEGCLGTEVNALSDLIVPLPSNVGFNAAATVPTVFVTVQIAFSHASCMQGNDNVLIHAAAGGVGLAALQVVQASGSNALATAGSSRKRTLLRSLGLKHVVNSRDTQYPELVSYTGGVDIALNSLTSSGMVGATLSTLGAGGRMVEIGKRDIWSRQSVRMERQDVTYELLAVDFLPPHRMQQMMLQTARFLASGSIGPLPQVIHSLGSVHAALRQMSQAKHIGKVVVCPGRDASFGMQETAIITGGAGSLGSELCAWNAHLPIRHTVALGRSGHASLSYAEKICSKSSQIVSIQSLLKCDASMTSDVEGMLHGVQHQIDVMIHVGGILADATLLKQSLQKCRSVFAPKQSALDILSNFTSNVRMDVSILFSSVASALGSPGQSNYSAANAYLDVFSTHQMSMGSSYSSICWGAWSGGGMATQNQQTALRLQRTGMSSLSAEDGISALACVMQSMQKMMPTPIDVVNPFNWPTFMSHIPRKTHYLGEHALVDSAPTSVMQGGAVSHGAPVNMARPVMDEDQVRDHLKSVVCGVIGHDVQSSEPLMAAGLDSLGATELRADLERVFSIELPGTLVFDYPTLEAIQTFICDSMQSLAGENVTVSSASLATEVQDVEDTLSMLCTSFALKGPSGMTTSSGKKIDTISRVPFARWDLDTVSSEYRDTRPPTFGSFMQDIAAFDIACTGLGLGEAKLMDVQQRALIQLTLELKMSSMALNGTTPVGVFVGISHTDYGRLCSKFQANVTTYSATGGALSVASGRLSYMFDFRGPAMSIDTACSSSLVTTHLANMQRKFSRTTNIVAGVNILTTPEATMMFHKAGMLSSDGRCKTLDASADGYVRGEFCGALCIESSDDGVAADASNSLPVALLGTAVNQDGRSSALTAPNGPAQQMVIRSALQHKSLDGGDVSLLQMHGTGTPLGDPIEVGALNAVLMDKRVDEHPLTLAAGKSGIGHTEPGAGAAGLIHSIEALINAASAAVVHLTSVNPHLHQIIGSKEKSKFNLPKISLGISHNVGDGDVVVGVSSFAFQGTNSHAILGCGSFSVYNKEDSSLSWQPQRCWVVPPVHPLLTSCLGFNAFDGTVKFQTSLTKALHAYLWDHQIQSKPLFPGAGYLEMGTALGQLMTDGGFASIVVEGASIPAPLVLPDSVTQFDEKVVEICVNALQSAHFSISSLSTRNGSTFSIEHFRASLGWLERSEGTSEQAISTPLCLCNEALRAQSTVPVPTSLLYAAMHSVGLQYMTKFQVLKTIRHQGSSSGEAFAQIGGQATSALNGMYTHPSALDGCLQLGATSLVSHASTDDQQTQVPAGIEAFVVYQQSKSAVLHAVAKTLHSSAQESVSQHGLYDPQGGCSSTVYNLLTKSMSSGASGVAASKAAMREKRSMTYFVQWNACLAESTISMPSDVSSKLELALKSEVSSMGLALSIVRDVMNKGHMPLNLRTFGAHGALDYPTNQVNTSQGHLWGLMRTVAQECQNLVCGGIDVGVEDPSNALGGDPLIVDSLLMKSVDSDVQGEALRD